MVGINLGINLHFVMTEEAEQFLAVIRMTSQHRGEYGFMCDFLVWVSFFNSNFIWETYNLEEEQR